MPSYYFLLLLPFKQPQLRRAGQGRATLPGSGLPAAPQPRGAPSLPRAPPRFVPRPPSPAHLLVLQPQPQAAQAHHGVVGGPHVAEGPLQRGAQPGQVAGREAVAGGQPAGGAEQQQQQQQGPRPARRRHLVALLRRRRAASGKERTTAADRGGGREDGD